MIKRHILYAICAGCVIMSGCGEGKNVADMSGQSTYNNGSMVQSEISDSDIGNDNSNNAAGDNDKVNSGRENDKDINNENKEGKSENSHKKHEDTDFVRVKDYIPNIKVDIKYATNDNFTGKKIYDFDDAYLRYGTVKKLEIAEAKLEREGYIIKIWDAFRPVSAQYKLWEECPNPTYVSDPNKGVSSHSRGNTIDITIVHSDGTEVDMPTGFDDFTKKADRDYSDCTKEQKKNAELLENILKDCDFKPYSGEWWHYSDNTSYEAEDKDIL